MNSYTAWLLVFIVISYIIITDSNVLKFFFLVGQYALFQFEKTKWIIMNSPSNFIVRWLIWRRSLQAAKKLQKEFEKNGTN